MVIVQAKVPADEALRLLNTYANENGKSISDVAADVMGRTVSFTGPQLEAHKL